MNGGPRPSVVVLGGLVLGLLLGLAYTWFSLPVAAKVIAPTELQGAEREHYRALVALAYAANGDRAQAEGRLNLLGEDRLPNVLDAQASRSSQPGEALALSELAAALRAPQSAVPSAVSQPTSAVDANAAPATPDSPAVLPTLVVFAPQPSATPDRTSGLRFRLSSQDTVCDPALPPGLLQVYVVDEEGGQVSGARVTVSWAGGQTDVFYTGLAPEIGVGYADFLMTPQVSYTVTVGEAGEPASRLVAPVCENADGSSSMGGIRTRFRP